MRRSTNSLRRIGFVVILILMVCAQVSAQEGNPSSQVIKERLMSRPEGSEDKIRTMGPGVREHVSARSTGSIDLQIPFELGSSQVTEQAFPLLTELGKALSDEKLRDTVFEIQGHTCTLGTAEGNLALSQERAKAVRNYLVTHFGLHQEQLVAKGYGQDCPVASNDTEEGRRQNRRVTIVNLERRYREARERPMLKINAVAMRGQQEIPLTPGVTLTEKDDYAVTFVASQSCYVYVYQRDALGKWQQLFPSSPESVHFTSRRNPVEAGVAYRIPEKGSQWLFLDEHKGTEFLAVVAYPVEVRKPLQVCRQLIGETETRLAEGPKHEGSGAVKNMGVKGVRETAQRTGVENGRSQPTRPHADDVNPEHLFHWEITFNNR